MFGKNDVIPRRHLTLGITLAFMSLFLLIPLAAFILFAGGMGLEKFWSAVTDWRNVHAYAVSFFCALVAGLVNVVFGLIIAWVLVRYDFKGKKIMDGLIDLPFALPTAVAGIALTTLYAQNGPLGSILYSFSIESAFSPLGITIALIFVGIGEYGSVVFIAGNMPYQTETAPLMIMTKLEQYDYQSAAAIAIVMMILSLAILLGIHGYQAHQLKKISAV